MRCALRLMDWSIGFMLDVDRNEIYEGLSSKYSYHQQFIDEVLNYCIGRPAFIVDNVYGLTCTRRTGINI
jgi:hypothetical protein